MAVRTEAHFPSDLDLIDAEGRRVSPVELSGPSRAVVWFFMRAANCAMCLRHARKLAALGLAARRVQVVVVVPGSSGDGARVRRAVADGATVVTTAGAGAHHALGLDRTLGVQHSGTLLVDATGAVRYRLVAVLPTGSFDSADLLAAVDSL